MNSLELENYFLEKIEQTGIAVAGRFPHVTELGRWVATSDGSWTGGFWVGLLWWRWVVTGASRDRQLAERYCEFLASRKDLPEADFDLGFLYGYSFGLGYRLTGIARYREIAVGAANHILELFHPEAGLIYHRYPGRRRCNGRALASSIIDVMMNLPLLWWAWSETKESRYYDIARTHAMQTAQRFVRVDGSTHQVVDFDLDTGEVLGSDTFQGYSDKSCWSRGLAWGVYGFLTAARFTGESLFIDVAKRMLCYWRHRIPGDGVPYWDFDDPARPNCPRDTSAAAIFCAALARVESWGLPIGEDVRHLKANTVRSLAERYLARRDADGVLGGGCFHYPRGEGVNAATIWGDYYFVESLNNEVLSFPG